MKLYGRLLELKRSREYRKIEEALSPEELQRLQGSLFEMVEVFYNRGWDDRDENTTDYVVKGLRKRYFNIFKGEIEDG